MNDCSSSPQVFINFQGHELRHNFISHLEKALRENEINFYIDMDSGPGENINFVFKRIEESKIALTVFSKGYTESAWRLNELVKIMQQVEAGKLIVIPIFYKVTVADVHNQTGEFGFSLHGRACLEKSNMELWKNALRSVCSKKGLSLGNDRSEKDFIADIVLAVKKVITEIDERVSTNISHLGLGRGPRVFISFHGKHQLTIFVSNVASSLQRLGVNVYIDTDEMKGKGLVNIFEIIKESEIALVFFSSRFTASPQCLNELVKIKELAEEGKLIAIPIFYMLNPLEVNGLGGEFGLNLWKNMRPNSELKNFVKWIEALEFVSQKRGIVVYKNSNLVACHGDIISRVQDELCSPQFVETENQHFELREQHKDAMKDSSFSISEAFKGVAGIIWDAKSDVKLEEVKSVHDEAELKRDDGLKLSVDDNFLCQTNSDASSKLQKSVENNRVDPVNEEKKQGNISKSDTVATYDNLTPQHQVFINFHGDDLRYGFVSHLKNALKRDGVNVYNVVDEKMDDNLETRFKVLEVSAIALVILSEMYPTSKWCLDELVKIMEQADERKLLVIPIFYKVEPSLVRHLEGSFGAQLRCLYRTHRDHNISKWKDALEYVTSKKGFVLAKYSDEVNFVTNLSLEVKKVIVQISLERIEKSQDQLSEQHKYATMDPD